MSDLGGDVRPALSRALFGVRTRHNVGRGGAFVWLGFILIPLITAIGRRERAPQHGLAIAGATAFIATYTALVLIWRRRRSQSIDPLPFVVLLALAAMLTLADRPTWGILVHVLRGVYLARDVDGVAGRRGVA